MDRNLGREAISLSRLEPMMLAATIGSTRPRSGRNSEAPFTIGRSSTANSVCPFALDGLRRRLAGC
jgi:hypothetical protein